VLADAVVEFCVSHFGGGFNLMSRVLFFVIWFERCGGAWSCGAGLGLFIFGCLLSWKVPETQGDDLYFWGVVFIGGLFFFDIAHGTN
jgi:hypothetical protein